MQILEDNYDILELEQMEEVDKWKKKVKKENIEKKQRIAYLKEKKNKEFNDGLLYVAIIGSLLLGLYIWLNK